ncbi:MAG: polysaccharide biosynthesis C-terminal domain-containing protein, partial [Lentisphaerae bacterium]|nr:polysaccharide biosynthesis C-terminal domain-containing protein [Lentisphaerota bacterium]
ALGSAALWRSAAGTVREGGTGGYRAPSVRRVLDVSLPMLATAGMLLVLGWTDTFMLGMFRPAAEVGVYRAAFKVGTLMYILVDGMRSIAGPQFAGLYAKGDTRALYRLLVFASTVIFWLGTPCYLLIVLLAGPLLGFFGPEFETGVPALIILASGAMVRAASGLVASLLQMTGHQVGFRNIMLAAGAANVLLNLALIPAFGMEGAAAATASSTVIWTLAASLLARRCFGWWAGYVPLREVMLWRRWKGR